jgi:hypothetical protein
MRKSIGKQTIPIARCLFIITVITSASLATDPWAMGSYIAPVRFGVQDGLYGTFFGGELFDQIRGVAIDSDGNIIVAGGAFSTDLPVLDAYQPDYGGGEMPSEPYFNLLGDGFIAKFSPDLELLWSTYVGGSDLDSFSSVDVDPWGNIYVIGGTKSDDFPLREGLSFTSDDDIVHFVAAFTPGGAPIGSRFFVEEGVQFISDLLCDGGDRVILVGVSESGLSVNEDAYQSEHGGMADGFLMMLSPDDFSLQYSTYLGGSTFDAWGRVSIDSDGDILVSGTTDSYDFPVTENAFQVTNPGDERVGAVAKFNGSGELLWATMLGGIDMDDIFGMTVDPSGRVLLVGRTWSPDFPVTPDAAQGEYSYVDVDGFMSVLEPDGASLVYSTFYGRQGWDSLLQVDTAPDGVQLVTGFVTTEGFETLNPIQRDYRGASDLIIMLNSADIEMVTYLGGTSSDHPYEQAIADGEIVVVGSTSSADFPVTQDGYQVAIGGEQDGFIFVLDYENFSGEGLVERDDPVENEETPPLGGSYATIGVLAIAILLWIGLMRRYFSSK